jgi:hypothetical protein
MADSAFVGKCIYRLGPEKTFDKYNSLLLTEKL